MFNDEELNEPFHETVDCEYYLPHDLNSKFMTSTNYFSLLHINLQCSVIDVTDTWLNKKSLSIFNIDGYSIVRSDRIRINGRGGGVAMYISNSPISKFASSPPLTPWHAKPSALSPKLENVFLWSLTMCLLITFSSKV